MIRERRKRKRERERGGREMKKERAIQREGL